MMSNLHAALKSVTSEDAGPDDVSARLNHLMCANIPINKFISCFYGLLDVRTRVLRFTNAGHNAPLLVRRDGETVRLSAGGRVLGAFTDSIYKQDEVQLCPGDRLLLFTDGISEVRNAAGEEFGEERLLELLAGERQHSAVKLRSIVMDRVSSFCGDQFEDDAALMILEAK
jgi:phosphoserine phosphatase RsbU/P